MNIINILFIFDIQKDETKEFQWDEGILTYSKIYFFYFFVLQVLFYHLIMLIVIYSI